MAAAGACVFTGASSLLFRCEPPSPAVSVNRVPAAVEKGSTVEAKRDEGSGVAQLEKNRWEEENEKQRRNGWKDYFEQAKELIKQDGGPPRWFWPLESGSRLDNSPLLLFLPAKKTMEVVKNLDVKRYMGRWYEIACFPSRFQPSDGINTRATYTLREDGTVNALNETWSGGKRSFIEGTAYKVDPNSDEAKLKVKVYVPPILPINIIPVTGDYWVLYIDHDYQYALIGQPSRRYVWILCRKPHLDEETYNELVQKARDEGYDVSKLHKTPQSGTPPEEEGPVDTIGVWWVKSLFGK